MLLGGRVSMQPPRRGQSLLLSLLKLLTVINTLIDGAHSIRKELSEEESLLEHLFRNYNPSARPVMDSSESVQVLIQFSLMHIKELHVKDQVLSTTGLLILIWRDERLVWEPKKHNGVKDIVIEAAKLWRPEFAVINGAEKIYEDFREFRATLLSNGTVRWEPGGVFKTMCEIDITYYPFDEQHCKMQFGAWTYHTVKMNLSNMEVNVNLDSYKENGEWEIAGTEVKRDEFAYECCPDERFSNVEFLIKMRRRHTFYILNVILPSIMTSVLLLSIFFCTPGQKVQIGVVVLLSFRIFLLNVAGNIPKTSDHIPILGIYLTATMAITTLSMVLTVLVLNLHFMTDTPPPEWAKKVVLVYLARILRMCCTCGDDDKEVKKAKKLKQNGYRPAANVDGDERTAIIELNTRPIHSDRLFVEAHANSTLLADADKEEAEKEPDYAKDWKRMAEVLDRLFFWFFLFAIVISTLVLFHPVTKSLLHGAKEDAVEVEGSI